MFKIKVLERIRKMLGFSCIGARFVLERKEGIMGSRGNRRTNKCFFVKKFSPVLRLSPVIMLHKLFRGLMVMFLRTQ